MKCIHYFNLKKSMNHMLYFRVHWDQRTWSEAVTNHEGKNGQIHSRMWRLRRSCLVFRVGWNWLVSPESNCLGRHNSSKSRQRCQDILLMFHPQSASHCLGKWTKKRTQAVEFMLCRMHLQAFSLLIGTEMLKVTHLLYLTSTKNTLSWHYLHLNSSY